MEGQNRKLLEYALIGAALILALVGSYFGIKLPTPDIPVPTARAFENTVCYLVTGGTGYTCGSGGAITLGTGSTLTATDAGAITFGSSLKPIGHATAGKSIVAGSTTTAGDGHKAIVHGLTSVDAAFATLCQKPTTTIAFASAIITSTTVTVHAWDSTLSASSNGATICYEVIGTK